MTGPKFGGPFDSPRKVNLIHEVTYVRTSAKRHSTCQAVADSRVCVPPLLDGGAHALR